MQNQPNFNQFKKQIIKNRQFVQKCCPTLPGQYLHYQGPFKLFWETKSLFKQLFLKWKVCLMCILKIYTVQYPKLYPDSQFLVLLIKKLLLQQNNEQKQLQFFSKYNHKQKIFDQQNCWLCEQLMQQDYINQLIKSSLQKINQNHYGNYQKYKLNIKVPLIFTLKYYFVCMYLWGKFETINSIDINRQLINEQDELNYKVSSQIQLNMIEKVLKKPYEKISPKISNNPILQMKVILKWLISFQINKQTQLQSTIQQLGDMLTINIQHEYHNQNLQNYLMQLFNHLVGLEKKQKSKHNNHNKIKQKPQKKLKIDLKDLRQIQQKISVNNEQFKCIANNVNKILYLKYPQIKHILSKFQRDQLFLSIFINNKPHQMKRQRMINKLGSIQRLIKLQTKNLCFSGKYCKYSRYISQTPWMINGIKLTEGSLQQQIQDQVLHYFYPKVPKQKIQTKFHSGGRQDIDVRMLKGGRPFVLELVNPIIRLQDLNLQKIIENSKLSVQQKKFIVNNMPETNNNIQKVTFVLQKIINKNTQLVQIKDFSQADESYISVQLKKAQIQKIKHYVCYIVSDKQLLQSDKQKIQKIEDLQLDQQTPLRVLHRRTLMVRKKIIHKMYMHLVSKHSAVLQLWASAGTYIKEFVHGDLQRTLPNLGSLINKNIDILQLDVGSLKQGNWEKGDDLKMKIQQFQWNN